MKKHPFNFAFTLACIVAIAFTARWYVTVLAVLAAIEWKVPHNELRELRETIRRNERGVV